jgi:hypothetical protein
MPGVTATVSARIFAKQTGTADIGTPQILVDLTKSMDFAPGTSSIGQSDILLQKTYTVAASGNTNIDVMGAIQDALGATINAAEIVAAYFEADTANVNDVIVTRPATNGVPLFNNASAGINLGANDFSLRTYRNGVTVVAGTGDLINIANGGAGTSVTVKVVLIGRTVAA